MNGKEWIQSAESNRGKQQDADYPKNIELLARAMECWDNLAGFRSDRERNKRLPTATSGATQSMLTESGYGRRNISAARVMCR